MLPQLFYAIVCAPAQRMFAVRWPGLRRTLTLTCGGVLIPLAAYAAPASDLAHDGFTEAITVDAEPAVVQPLAELLAPLLQEAQMVIYRDVADAAVQLYTASLIVSEAAANDEDLTQALWDFYHSELGWVQQQHADITGQLSDELYRLTVTDAGSRPYLAYWLQKARLWQTEAASDAAELKKLLAMREKHWPEVDGERLEIMAELAGALARTDHLQAEKLYLALAQHYQSQGRETESQIFLRKAREQQQQWNEALDAGFH